MSLFEPPHIAGDDPMQIAQAAGELDNEIPILDPYTRRVRLGLFLQYPGDTAPIPAFLLEFASEALEYDTGEKYNADLHYAFREMKAIVTVPGYDPLSDHYHSFTMAMTSMRWFHWESFAMCCTYLSRPEALQRHPVSVTFWQQPHACG